MLGDKKSSKQVESNLGLMYDEGDGVPEDDKEAVKWYRRAATNPFCSRT